MYRFAYAEILDDEPTHDYSRQCRAMEQAVELLEAAEISGPRSREAMEALSFVRNLWAAFMQELSSPDHELPHPWRANLLAIGRFVLGEVERIRFGKSRDFRRLIDISKSVAEGLR
jgi:flagellar protein FlaF